MVSTTIRTRNHQQPSLPTLTTPASSSLCAAATAAQQEQIASLPSPSSPSITFSQLQTLSSLHRSLVTPSFSPLSPSVPSYLHELLSGASLYTAPPVARPRDPAFLRFLQRQRVLQDRREYRAMVSDLPGNKSGDEKAGGAGSGVASASRELGHGLNILTLMVTGFAVFYYAGTMVGDRQSTVVPVIFGLVGLVGAMMVEMVLLMIRERRRETMDDAVREERKERERERDALKRIRVKEDEMRRIGEQMAQSAAPVAAAVGDREAGLQPEEARGALGSVEGEQQRRQLDDGTARRRKGHSVQL